MPRIQIGLRTGLGTRIKPRQQSGDLTRASYLRARSFFAFRIPELLKANTVRKGVIQKYGNCF
ncbi:hypothetical protein [Effusibacillus consociatus]|uniref:Uncharacterized protein n=1 Tax=Effusibacillus consociatus TaxID=1117041 RepID=A0ABV9Q3T2_9BACL